MSSNQRINGHSVEMVELTPNLVTQRVSGNGSISFTCPTNEMWLLSSIQCVYTASATAGSRTIWVKMFDQSSAQVFGTRFSTAITAGLLRIVLFTTYGSYASSFYSGLNIGYAVLPAQMHVLPGFTLTVVDDSAIDIAGDLNTVTLCYSKNII